MSRIDYARMQQVWPRQEAALTRAVKSGSVEQVENVCRDAVRVWDEVGAWPDDWSLFQRTLDDAYSKARLGYAGPRLEDL